MISVIIFIIIYGVRIVTSYDSLNRIFFNAPVKSIMLYSNKIIMPVTRYSNFSNNVTIGRYLVIVNILRMIGMLSLTSVILAISKHTKNIMTSYFVAIMVLLVPAIICYLNLADLSIISYLDVLSTHVLFEKYSFGEIYIIIGVNIAVIIVGLTISIKPLKRK